MSSKSLTSNISQPNLDLRQKILQAVSQEYLRQSQLTFNLSLVAISASILISVTGAVLLICGKGDNGKITTATGLLTTITFTQMAKVSSHKLEQLRRSLQEF